ncbi:sugar nucleotide-binding protein [Staphylococcus epidermidis]|nr:sugar nucleotide-binding protein [Staphylococcus epidermidis]
MGEVVALDRQTGGDISNLTELAQTIRSVRPDVIVNAAAHTAVDKAESEPDLALRLNAEAPEVMAQRLKAWALCWCTTAQTMFSTALAQRHAQRVMRQGHYRSTVAPNSKASSALRPPIAAI